jgi:general secretion pathway protein L
MAQRNSAVEADRNLTSARPEVPVAAAPGVVHVTGEDVLLLAVAMPDMSAAQRRAAVAFAVEDRIARPLDEEHVILGPALPDHGDGKRWLVAVIARDRLAAIPVVRKTRLMPDVLALPVPQAGQWSVWAIGLRALVRTPDGAGFATAAAALPVYHLAAGRPGIVLYGGALDGLLPVLRTARLPAWPDPALERFDLNTARATIRSANLPRAWRQIAALLVLAGLGHAGLLMADTLAIGRIRDISVAALREALAAAGQPAEGDLETAIRTALARSQGTVGPRLMPMLARAFAALGPEAGRVFTSDLRYAADQNSLMLTLQAPDIVTLQGVETALTGAGFRVTAGAATTGDGIAEQQMTLQGEGT